MLEKHFSKAIMFIYAEHIHENKVFSNSLVKEIKNIPLILYFHISVFLTLSVLGVKIMISS